MQTFTEKEKEKIGQRILLRYQNSGFTSRSQFAISIGFTGSDMTHLLNQKWKKQDSLIGIEKWVRLAKQINFNKNQQLHWKTAETALKQYLFMQMESCRQLCTTGLFIDSAGIGKTHVCKEFALSYPHVFYLDCSHCTTKSAFIRCLAQLVGIGKEAHLETLLFKLISSLQQMDRPLLILDEAGELSHNAILVLKRLYNALEDLCGIYLLGAEGLKSRILSGIRNNRQGFAEVFSRLGNRFSQFLPPLRAERMKVLKQMAKDILLANGITDKETLKEIILQLNDADFSDMRRIKREVIKRRL